MTKSEQCLHSAHSGGGGGFSLYAVYADVPLDRYGLAKNCLTYKGPHLKFCLTKGSLFGPKSALQMGPFLLKIEVPPLTNACFANFKCKIFASPLNHTFLGIFCLPFRKFALKQGQNLGAAAPYRRLGFEIPKWHFMHAYSFQCVCAMMY